MFICSAYDSRIVLRFGSAFRGEELRDHVLHDGVDGSGAGEESVDAVADHLVRHIAYRFTRDLFLAAENLHDVVDRLAEGDYTGTGLEDLVAELVILVAVGRAPDTCYLQLDKAGIAVEKNFIQTNEKMETNVPGVYAVGDCTGKLMLAHAAMAMGETAAENAMGGCKTFDPDKSPSCAYVGPEFAGVGYTEEKAKELGIAYKVGKFPTMGNGRSMVDRQTDGMIKILAGEKYGEILGVHILAPTATELIEEAALAIRLEATLEEFTDTIHCHPTVAEAVRECALAVDKKAIHI